MKRVYLTIGLVVLAAFMSVSAVAEPEAGKGGRKSPGRMHRGGPGGGSGHRIGFILKSKEKLDISEKQVAQLKAIQGETKGQFKASAEAVGRSLLWASARRSSILHLATPISTWTFPNNTWSPTAP